MGKGSNARGTTADSSELKSFGMTYGRKFIIKYYEGVTCCCPAGACAGSKYGSSGITIHAMR